MNFFNRHPKITDQQSAETVPSVSPEALASANSTAEAGKVALQGNVAIEVQGIDDAVQVEVQHLTIDQLDERSMHPDTIAAQEQLQIDAHIDGYQ